MRRLATIRTVADVRPIEGADAIECVVVGGWQVVAKKGEFTPGDLCVYFEIDSVLPICEEFEFLRKGCYVKKDWLITANNPNGEGFRLKTIRLRGQISQGLVIPLRKNDPMAALNTIAYHAGNDDVTGLYDVVKWDPPVPACLSGRVIGNFPSFIPKTDQERIQNITARDFEKYVDDIFERTVKLDGSSMTVYHYNGKVGVCSRNLELDIENSPDTTFATVFTQLDFAKILPELGNIAIQGELMGPGIQGNRENLKSHELYVYDVYDIDSGKYYPARQRFDLILNMDNGIKHCPVLDDVLAANMSLEEHLICADGPSLNHAVREGVVYKSIDNPSFSFKVISNKFLLKGE